MRTRTLGQTGLEVSVIGFGGAAVSGEGRGYGFGAIGEAESIDLCRACLDAGINLFDTAPIYGHGLSEQRLGKAFRDRREDVILVSKCGVVWDDRKRIKIDNRPQVVNEQLEQSLRDLQTERIDVYLVHWPDEEVDIRATLEPLARAREAGKIGHIGLSNSNPEEIDRASEVAEIATLQNQLNLFSRWPVEGLFPTVAERNLGFMTYGTLDKGILTRRVTPDRQFDRHDVRSRAPWWTNADRSPKYAAMERIAPLLEAAGHSGLELALGFVLQFDTVSTALCGLRTREYLETAIEALGHLPAEEVIGEALTVATEYLP